MCFAICVVPVSPLRSEPSHRSEMVSQQLFGETCSVVEREKDHWIKIKCQFDGYEGWCQDMHVMEIENDQYPTSVTSFTSDIISRITFKGDAMQLPFGASVITDDRINTLLDIAYNGNIWTADAAKKDEATIRKLAIPFLNTGYLWGGKSIFGVDCSGFSQTVFKMMNIPLLRDAYQQAAQGEGVGFLQEARCGDLAFFDNAEGKITHVGILLNDHQVIHSSGKVRVDKIDNQGIISSDTGERTHKLRIIKRYFDLMSS